MARDNYKFVTLRDVEAGESRTHMRSVYGDYSTLCGLSDNDDESLMVREPTSGSQIDCDHCKAIYTACKNYRAKDFA